MLVGNPAPAVLLEVAPLMRSNTPADFFGAFSNIIHSPEEIPTIPRFLSAPSKDQRL